MKLSKMMAGMMMVGMLGVVGAFGAACWTPTTGSCTQTTSCVNGKVYSRSGTDTWCVSGGSSSCTPADCTYGAWTSSPC